MDKKLTYKEWMFFKIKKVPTMILNVIKDVLLGIAVGIFSFVLGILLTLAGVYLYGVPLLVFGFFLWTYSEYRNSYSKRLR